MSLAKCLGRMNKMFKDYDVDSVVALAEKYQKDGMSEDEAGVKAVNEKLSELEADKTDVQKQVAEAYQKSDPDAYKEIVEGLRKTTKPAEEKQEAPKVRPTDPLEHQILVNLSASTTSIPVIRELKAEASIDIDTVAAERVAKMKEENPDMTAEKLVKRTEQIINQVTNERAKAGRLLSDMARDTLDFLTGGIQDIAIEYEYATGTYEGDREPSLGVKISFNEADRLPVLSALSRIGQSFEQFGVYSRGDAQEGTKADYVYSDGSYNTTAYKFILNKPMDVKEVEGIITKAGLKGITITDEYLETYFSGDIENGQEVSEYEAGVERLHELLAGNGQAVDKEVQRLWRYGNGQGYIPYGSIDGHLRPGRPSHSLVARRLAARYLGRAVKTSEPATELTKEQAEFQDEIKDAYEHLNSNNIDSNRLTERAYRELAYEVVQQYFTLPIRVEFFRGEGEPYENSEAMRTDVLQNNHLYIYQTTEETFGQPGVSYEGHPLLKDASEIAGKTIFDINGVPMMVNDLFRAVHDYYAHTTTPAQFGILGEEAAWRNHMAMTLSPWARWALTTETRGQNSWVNRNTKAGILESQEKAEAAAAKLNETAEFEGQYFANKVGGKQTVFRRSPQTDMLPHAKQDEVVTNMELPQKFRPFADQKADLLPIRFVLTGDPEIDQGMEILRSEPDRERSESDREGFRKTTEIAIYEIEKYFPQWLKGKPAKSKAVMAKLKASSMSNLEAEWMGLFEFLEMTPEVTREQLLEFVEQNGIELETVYASDQARPSRDDYDFDWHEEILEPDDYLLSERADEWLANMMSEDSHVDTWFENHEDKVAGYVKANYKLENIVHEPALIEGLDHNDIATMAKNYDFGENVYNDIKKNFREDIKKYLRPAAEKQAQEEYYEWPGREYISREHGVSIIQSQGPGEYYALSWREQYYDSNGFTDAEERARDWLVEDGILTTDNQDDDVLVARWKEHMSPGAFYSGRQLNNYRNIKILLPNMEETWTNESHYPDENIAVAMILSDQYMPHNWPNKRARPSERELTKESNLTTLNLEEGQSDIDKLGKIAGRNDVLKQRKLKAKLHAVRKNYNALLDSKKESEDAYITVENFTEVQKIVAAMHEQEKPDGAAAKALPDSIAWKDVESGTSSGVLNAQKYNSFKEVLENVYRYEGEIIPDPELRLWGDVSDYTKSILNRFYDKAKPSEQTVETNKKATREMVVAGMKEHNRKNDYYHAYYVYDTGLVIQGSDKFKTNIDELKFRLSYTRAIGEAKEGDYTHYGHKIDGFVEAYNLTLDEAIELANNFDYGRIIKKENLRENTLPTNTLMAIEYLQKNFTAEERGKLVSLLDETRDLDAEIDKASGGAASFPYQEDAWIDLMAKALVREAVAKGKTEISWTGGEAMIRRWERNSLLKGFKTVYNQKLPAAFMKHFGAKTKHYSYLTGMEIEDAPEPKEVLGSYFTKQKIEEYADTLFKMFLDQPQTSDTFINMDSLPGVQWFSRGHAIFGASFVFPAGKNTVAKGDPIIVWFRADDGDYGVAVAIAKEDLRNPNTLEMLTTDEIAVYSEETNERSDINDFFNRALEVETGWSQYKKTDLEIKIDYLYNRVMDNLPVEITTEPDYFVVKVSQEMRDRELEMKLFQDRRGEFIQKGEERYIKLGETSDLSTFLHESGHLFLEMEKKFAEKYGLTDDHKALLKWLGAESFDELNPETDRGREMHEKFARGFEAYLREGKAPSIALRDAFAAFARWLKRLYQNLILLDVELNDEIRQVFDRMLATEEEIAAARANPMYDQFFKSQEQAGMGDKEWERYQKLQNRSTESAELDLNGLLLKELRARYTKEWNDEKKEIIAEEKERLNEEPIYKLLRDIRVNQLDHAEVLEILGADKLPKKMAFKTKKGGVSVEVYAEAYGFASPKKMLEEIQTVQKLDDAAKEAAQQKMLAKHGDILNDGTIEQEAREAVHTEEQAKLLLMEIKSLNKKGKKKPIDINYLKFRAKDMIGSLKWADIKPNKYYRAELRAAQNAVKADNEYDKLVAKIQQLSNHYLYKEAMQAKNDAERFRKYIQGVANREYSTRDVSNPYIVQLAQLAKMYQMQKSPEKKQMTRAFLAWYKTQIEDKENFIEVQLMDTNLVLALSEYESELKGEPSNLPPFDMKSWKDMTVEELHGVYDQLVHLRYVGGQMANVEKAQFKMLMEDGTQSVIDNGGKDKANKDEPGRYDSWVDTGTAFLLGNIHIKNLTRRLDGMEEHGWFDEHIFKLVEESSNTFQLLQMDMAHRYAEELGDLEGVVLGKQNKVTKKKEGGGEWTLSSEGRIMLTLYWGTESSRDAIMEGHKVTEEDVMNMMEEMSAGELELVNRVWRLNESLKGDISSLSSRMYGVAPTMLEATPFAVKGVKMTGGHMRLYYARSAKELDLKEEGLQASSPLSYSKPGTMHERKGSGGKMVFLDKSNIIRSLNENLHALAHAENAKKIARILNNRNISAAIQQKHGIPFYNALVDSVSSVMTYKKDKPIGYGVQEFSRLIRVSATYKHLGFSLRNTVQQFSAVPISAQEVGAGALAIEMLAFSSDPVGYKDKIVGMSPFMKTRFATVNREAAENLNKISEDSAWNRYKELSFIMQTTIDMVNSYPTWMARYKQSMEKYSKDATTAMELAKANNDAISDADTAVAETIGSGLDRHIGALFSSKRNEAIRMVTMFGTWFNSYANRVYRDYHRADSVMDAQLMKTVFTTPIIVAALSAVLVSNMPDDDEEWHTWLAKEYGSFMLALLPFIRDITGAARGFAAKSPSGSFSEAFMSFPKEAQAYLEGKQTGLKTVIDISKGVTTFVPLPGSGQVIRMLEYWDSYEQGNEEKWRDPAAAATGAYQAITEGKTRQ